MRIMVGQERDEGARDSPVLEMAVKEVRVLGARVLTTLLGRLRLED